MADQASEQASNPRAAASVKQRESNNEIASDRVLSFIRLLLSLAAHQHQTKVSNHQHHLSTTKVLNHHHHLSTTKVSNHQHHLPTSSINITYPRPRSLIISITR